MAIIGGIPYFQTYPYGDWERERERERAREQKGESVTNRLAEPAILRRCDDMCMFLQDKRDGMYQVQQVLFNTPEKFGKVDGDVYRKGRTEEDPHPEG